MTESHIDQHQLVEQGVADLGTLAQGIQACPAVAGLHPGTRRAIGTQTSRGWLAGLCLHGHVLVVGVVGFVTFSTTMITDQVRAAVKTHARDLYVVVIVVDSQTQAHRGRALRHRR